MNSSAVSVAMIGVFRMSSIFNFETLRDQLKKYFDCSLFSFINSSALICVFFAGRFSIDRLVSESYRTKWLELRFLGICFSLFYGAYLFQKKKMKPLQLNWGQVASLIALLIFQIYFLVNASIIGNSLYLYEAYYESFIMFIGLGLIIYHFREEKDFLLFCKLIQILAGLFFALALVGVGNPDLNGPGWAPFGGPITFYRIEFFAFCASWYLASKSHSKYGKLIHLLVGATALYSTLASLSKIAYGATYIILAYLVYNFLVKKNYKEAMRICVLGFFVLVFFSIFHGEVLKMRINKIVDIEEKKIDSFSDSGETSFVPGDIKKIYSNNLSFNDLDDKQKEKMLVLGAYFKESYPNFKEEFASFIRGIDRYVIMLDASTRLRMLVKGYELFKKEKLFGVGVGNYSYTELSYRAPDGRETYRYPHNVLLELLATTGVVGFALFLVALFICFVIFGQLVTFSSLMIFQGYLLFFLLSALFAGDLLDFKVFWFVGWVVIRAHSQTKMDLHDEKEFA